MPTGGSIADTLRECRGYIVTLDVHAAELPPNMKEIREEIMEAVAETEQAGIRQSQHTALVQQATQDQEKGRLKCRDLASRVRSFLRGFYGPTNEALNHFGIQPRRFSRRAQTKPPETGPTPPQAATPAAGVTT